MAKSGTTDDYFQGVTCASATRGRGPHSVAFRLACAASMLRRILSFVACACTRPVAFLCIRSRVSVAGTQSFSSSLSLRKVQIQLSRVGVSASTAGWLHHDRDFEHNA